MFNKWMSTSRVTAVVTVSLGAALVLTGCKATPTTSGTVTSSGSSNTTASAPRTANSPSGSNGATSASTPSDPKLTAAGAARIADAKKQTSLHAIRPFPKLPDPKVAARKVTSPLPKGEKLPPLTEAPANTVSALATKTVPNNSAYEVVVRPYGLGPDLILGSRVVVLVDSIKPVGKTAPLKNMVGENVLVLVDTRNGGSITKGGTYNATITFSSDGQKLLPVISQVSAK